MKFLAEILKFSSHNYNFSFYSAGSGLQYFSRIRVVQAQHEKLFQPLLSGFGLDRYYFSSGFNTRKFQKEVSKYKTLGLRITRMLGQIGTKLFDNTLNEVKFQSLFFGNFAILHFNRIV